MPEIEYYNKDEMPCDKLKKGAEQADKMAGQLAKQQKDAETVIGVCPQCGIHLIRQVLENKDPVYLPGRGWPENCTQLNPIRHKGRRRH